MPISLDHRCSASRSRYWRSRAVRSPPRRSADFGFHTGQRIGAGRHPRPSRAGRHAHDLVQGRRRRRDAGQIGHRAFSRAPDVQGHGEKSGRKILAGGRRASAVRRTPSPRRTTPATSSACRASSFETVMEFEADRMTGLQLTDDVVLPERNVILEEQNQRVGNNPRARLGEQIDAALYLNHPYGKPVIGWRHEMEQLSRDDAIGFYRRFYAPNNAVVVIAGDVDPRKVRTLAEETYGKIAASRHDRRRACGRKSRRRSRCASLTLADPRVEMPSSAARISRAVLPRRQSAAKSEALEVLVAHSRQRLEQPPLSRAGRRQADRRHGRAPGTTPTRSICRNSASTARRAPASRCRSLKRKSTRSSRRSSTRA